MAEPKTYERALQLGTGVQLSKFIQTFLEDGDKLVKIIHRKQDTEVVLTFEEKPQQ